MKALVHLVLDIAEPSQLVVFLSPGPRLSRVLHRHVVRSARPQRRALHPLVLQGVPEPRVGKNRLHLDIVVDDIEAEVERLQALGAHRLDEGHQHFGDTLWVRMSDPEHNEFCVCTGVKW